MYTRTYYVSIAVEKLDEAVPFFRDILGLSVAHTGEHRQLMAKATLLSTGDGGIALLQPTSKNSPIAGFLEKTKNRIFHIALGVDNIEGTWRALKAKGAADGRGGLGQGLTGRSFMIDPGQVTGYNIEVTEAVLPLRDPNSQMLRIEGVQMATGDVNASVKAFKEVLGLEPHAPSSGWEFPELGVRNRVYIVGRAQLELNEVVKDTSPFQRYLQQEGRNGCFGFSIEPKDLKAYVNRLKGLNVRSITPEPVPLAIVPPGGKQQVAADILTLHPSQTQGARVFVLSSYVPWNLL